MKNGKLNLGAIGVKSFKTSLDKKSSLTIRGGYEDSDCRTLCKLDCQSGNASGCNSCGGTGGSGGGGTETQERITCLVAC